jgi:hypothetical protein
VIQKRIHVSFLRHFSPADGISAERSIRYMHDVDTAGIFFVERAQQWHQTAHQRISVWCPVYHVPARIFVSVCLPGRHLQSFRGATAYSRLRALEIWYYYTTHTLREREMMICLCSYHQGVSEAPGRKGKQVIWHIILANPISCPQLPFINSSLSSRRAL